MSTLAGVESVDESPEEWGGRVRFQQYIDAYLSASRLL